MEGMLMIDLAGGTLLYHKTFRCQMDKKKNSEYYMNMGAFMFALYTYSNSDDLVRTNTRSSASDGSPQDIHHDGMKVVSSGPPSLSRYQMNHKCFYFWEHRSPSISFLVVLIVNHIRVQDNHITPALATEIIQAQAVAFGQSYVPGQSIKVNRQMYHRECMSIIREMAYGLLRQMSKSTDTGLDWIVILQPPHNLGSWSELVQQVHSSKARIEIPRLSKRFRWPSFAFLRKHNAIQPQDQSTAVLFDLEKGIHHDIIYAASANPSAMKQKQINHIKQAFIHHVSEIGSLPSGGTQSLLHSNSSLYSLWSHSKTVFIFPSESKMMHPIGDAGSIAHFESKCHVEEISSNPAQIILQERHEGFQQAAALLEICSKHHNSSSADRNTR